MKFAKFMILMVFAAACYATDLGTKENPLTIGSVQELLQKMPHSVFPIWKRRLEE